MSAWTSMPARVWYRKLLFPANLSFRGDQPAEEEEMMPAQFAAERTQQPVQGAFHAITHAHASEMDRAAVRTLGGEIHAEACIVEGG